MKAAQISLIDTLEGFLDIPTKVQANAFTHLKDIGLPGKKSETYKFTPISQVLAKQINWEENETSFAFDKHELYKFEGSHLVIVNGVLDMQNSKIDDTIEVSTEAITEGKHDPFSLLNTAMANQEIKVTCKSSSNIFLYHYTTRVFTNPRVMVLTEKNVECNVVEKVINQSSFNAFINLYTSFQLGNNSSLKHTKIQDYNSTTFTHETTTASVSRDARFYNNTYSFGGALIRNNLRIDLDDEYCEGYMHGVFLLDGKSHVDNNTSVDHKKPNAYSDEVYKGIVDEKATGIFNGKIYVRKDAQKTNAFQSNNNILLSDDAVIHTKPQLEIWADDVKCSHGCTTGQLDKDAVFYLRSRGINERDAKSILLKAFASEALEHVSIAEIRTEIEKKIEEKLD
jgi:Fe-S cluster assembly protein SufD